MTNLSPQAGFDVILPAGGKIEGAFAEATGVTYKALLPLRESLFLTHIVETFRTTPGVRRIVVIGGEEVGTEANRVEVEGVLPEGHSGPENIFRGLDWLQSQPNPATRVVVATTDLPFLTSTGLTSFLKACPSEAEIAVPIIRAKDFEARYPNTASTYVPIRQESITVGCVFQLSPEALLRARPHIEQLFEARKSQLALARVVGFGTLFRLLTRRLEVKHIEARCERLLKCRGHGVMGAAPELAYDVDTLEDYKIAQKHLSA